MTDDPDLTPEQEREVRRMLVDARHAEPVPGDVAARLDRVLAELAAGEHGSPSPVSDLASHRRRRVTTLLVAAAAVVAIGVGLGQVLPLQSDSDSTSSADAPMSAVGGAESGSDNASRSKRERPPAVSGNDLSSGAAPGTLDSLRAYGLRRPIRLSEDTFSADVRRAQDRALAASGDLAALQDSPELSNGRGNRHGLKGFGCPGANWGAGVFVPATYAGDPAVLVFRRASGDTQVAELFQCGSSVAIRSVTLPAP